jgi:hypothetical protein
MRPHFQSQQHGTCKTLPQNTKGLRFNTDSRRPRQKKNYFEARLRETGKGK